jgi:hypothetical protein
MERLAVQTITLSGHQAGIARVALVLLALVVLGLAAILSGCAADPAAQDNRPRTASEFIGQPRPAP